VRKKKQYLMSVVAVVLMVCMVAVPVNAIEITHWEGTPFDYDVFYMNPSGKTADVSLYDIYDAKVTVKNSNSKVAVASYDGSSQVTMKVKKAGTNKVTITAKKGKETKSVEKTLYVKKYSNPFASFKVGKKDVAKSFEPNVVSNFALGSGIMAGKSLKSGEHKIQIKLKKGYTLVSIAKASIDIDPTETKLKNGKTYELNDSEVIYVRVKDSSGHIAKLCILTVF
jgi:hypothetical protein